MANHRRPSRWWFALGGGLLILALATVVIAIVFFASALVGFLKVDATVPDDGQAHALRVPTDPDRMLWAENGIADCEIRDADTGRAISVRPVSADLQRGNDSGSWRVVGRFDPGSGNLTVQCTGGRAQIGPATQITHFLLDAALLVLVPTILGLLGLASLIITGVLYATGRPRNQPAQPRVVPS